MKVRCVGVGRSKASSQKFNKWFNILTDVKRVGYCSENMLTLEPPVGLYINLELCVLKNVYTRRCFVVIIFISTVQQL